MNELKGLRFEVWLDGTAFISIRAEDTGVPEKDKGIHRIWFVMTAKEFRDAANGRTTALSDGYHKAQVYGDLWTFYDQDSCGSRRYGSFECPFVRVEFPQTFMRAILRLAEREWARLRQIDKDKRRDEPRMMIHISPEHAAHVCRLYGQGRGKVEWVPREYRAAETREQLEKLLATSADLRDKMDRLLAIARNSTRGFHQRAHVQISGTYTGEEYFDWCAVAPDGRTILWGGLINHGKDGVQDWGIHT